MKGTINESDLELVRERAKIEDIVGTYVTLRRAGADLSGLCPFHDEKTPSFHVTPTRGLYYCFGCGVGGDVVDFEMRINNMSFVEAITSLADKVGVQLRFEDDGGNRPAPGLRSRIMAANGAAAEFFAAALLGNEGLAARQMLDGRGFDRRAAEEFGVGYAPKAGRALHEHLHRAGFTDEELSRAGLIREKGGWDFFQGRVLWPIRDSAGGVLGFGARRLYDDDRLPAKYINTPETPVYKKSSVLYGLDLARQAIGKESQAVVMEGYTDVMAAHLSGVKTAVASCGTAFTGEHAKTLQRLIGAGGMKAGRVIFTFDGDAPGQAAALKVFRLDQSFTAYTYVAVSPDGLDPCDLRLAKGETAVRDLIGRAEPLYLFVMANIVAGFDLDRAEGRLEAVRSAAAVIGHIRDAELVSGYLRDLARLVGMDVDEVRRIAGRSARRTQPARPEPSAQVSPDAQLLPWPDPDDIPLAAERGVLQLMLQNPELFSTEWNELRSDDFGHPTYRAVFDHLVSVGYDPTTWPAAILETPDAVVHQLMLELLVAPLLRPPTAEYARAYAARVQLSATNQAIADLKSRLQRTNPVSERAAHTAMFTQLLELETKRQRLAQASLGAN